MGTRAMVLFEGKPVLATHWDGHPETLGKKLNTAHPKNIQSIIRASAPNSIDWIDPKIETPKKPIITSSGLAHIKKKTYFAKSYNEEMALSNKLKLGGGSADAKGKIKIAGAYGKYDDFAEYIYNVHKDGSVDVSEASGSWQESKKLPKHFESVTSVLKRQKLKEMT